MLTIRSAWSGSVVHIRHQVDIELLKRNSEAAVTMLLA
jgi:hypothetical protein